MSYEFMDFSVIVSEQNHELYEKYKEHTLKVARILEEAKMQRNALALSQNIKL